MYVDERSNIENFIVPTLKLRMEMGWIGPVERLINFYMPTIRKICSEETISIFEEAKLWLERAIEHERIHGKNSLLNYDHPVCRRALKRIEKSSHSH
ncbi:hypothetical protein [Chelativorans sp. YIM 93263]|uniref:hypothetical protein n=1 Tax=Chelativorans sp. YIM 93263 TaxID=2906648 RepID=UPI002377ECAA|nr:hypothetical protein [Chelativorans sp. YIM 93263]